ncbi:glycoside hydrolase family 2 TIM barrel-domain containing protein [Leifsonia sp. NPDC058194]|uniref:glycoside hydrolase family 2 TIM barrel-domain containing protein n=1 Tax=Leifsonia sp. NPDC058194 TaxID=3346374 RepID=UPI0036DCDED8
MKRTLFNDGWQVRQKVNPFAELGGATVPYEPVTLPHDAQIGRDRDPSGDAATAYFPSGAYQYRKTFAVPEEFAGKRVVIEFEGAYRDATVHINGAFAGNRPYGYSTIAIDADRFLEPGAENLIEVETRNGDDSRWYTGAGLYRNVWLHVGSELHVPATGLRIRTPEVDRTEAVVEVEVSVASIRPRRATVDVEVRIVDPDGDEVATGTVPVTVEANGTSVSRQRLRLASPRLWSAETPDLYRATARVVAEGETADEAETGFGVRRLQVDPVNGLRVNGETVKLRGACIHHDNGILGAATHPAAEERRVRLLKEAGFNAIRSAHNPASVALLEACDRLGMYVMDETFDIWTSNKMPHDYSLDFPEWWERDVESLVAKDFNHPSVILYSIGNEIPETGSSAGGLTGRALAEKVRALDPTRFVTNAVNGMLSVMGDLAKLAAERGQGTDDSAGINTLMSGPGEFMNQIGASPLVTAKTAESFGVLDVAGMNYLDARYAMDAELFPNRVIVGTETFPTHIDRNWASVLEHPHVIGDFTWTGFDYLGEVGIGRPQRLADGEQPTHAAPYPWIAAWCGDLDLTGGRRPASFYREIVFGLRSAPAIAVQRPGPVGATVYTGPWTWSDSIASWTWQGHEGDDLVVEVYSDADEVELAVNGEAVGVQPAGAGNRFTAHFTVPYAPGTLTATALRAGRRAETHELATATGEARLSVTAGVEAGDAGIHFVEIALVDANGRVFSDRDVEVTVAVGGAGELLAAGSADPAPEAGYAGPAHRTFDGRAFAVVRADADSWIEVSADGYATVRLPLAPTAR